MIIWKGTISYYEQFEKIVGIIESTKERAFRKVNEELILMYRDIGEYISVQPENAEYGDAFVQKLADFFAEKYPELKGFNRRGLYRMKQFYELYKDNEKVSPLVTQLSWTNHLKIISACKTMEERMQVGKHDYYIDLLLYHRGLSCLVAFELKIGEFKPVYFGKINLYFEALDREVKKKRKSERWCYPLCKQG